MSLSFRKAEGMQGLGDHCGVCKTILFAFISHKYNAGKDTFRPEDGVTGLPKYSLFPGGEGQTWSRCEWLLPIAAETREEKGDWRASGLWVPQLCRRLPRFSVLQHDMLKCGVGS